MGTRTRKYDAELVSDAEERCPACGTERQDLWCVVCGRAASYIDCGHYPQPRPIAAGRDDGSDLDHDYCEDCAEGSR